MKQSGRRKNPGMETIEEIEKIVMDTYNNENPLSVHEIKSRIEILSRKMPNHYGLIALKKSPDKEIANSMITFYATTIVYEFERTTKELKFEKERYLCPISLDVMKEPVSLSQCGHTFDKDFLVKCLSYQKKCPVENKIIRNVDFVPNWMMKQNICDYGIRFNFTVEFFLGKVLRILHHDLPELLKPFHTITFQELVEESVIGASEIQPQNSKAISDLYEKFLLSVLLTFPPPLPIRAMLQLLQMYRKQNRKRERNDLLWENRRIFFSKKEEIGEIPLDLKISLLQTLCEKLRSRSKDVELTIDRPGICSLFVTEEEKERKDKVLFDMFLNTRSEERKRIENVKRTARDREKRLRKDLDKKIRELENKVSDLHRRRTTERHQLQRRVGSLKQEVNQLKQKNRNLKKKLIRKKTDEEKLKKKKKRQEKKKEQQKQKQGDDRDNNDDEEEEEEDIDVKKEVEEWMKYIDKDDDEENEGEGEEEDPNSYKNIVLSTTVRKENISNKNNKIIDEKEEEEEYEYEQQQQEENISSFFPHNPLETVVSGKSKISVFPERRVGVEIVDCVNAKILYVHTKRSGLKIFKIRNFINRMDLPNKPDYQPSEIGELVFVHFSVDKQWYRGKVISLSNNTKKNSNNGETKKGGSRKKKKKKKKFSVQMIDWGTFVEVTSSQIRKYCNHENESHIPPQAILVHMAFVAGLSKSKQKRKEALNLWKDISRQTEIVAELEYQENEVKFVSLFDRNSDVNLASCFVDYGYIKCWINPRVHNVLEFGIQVKNMNLEEKMDKICNASQYYVNQGVDQKNNIGGEEEEEDEINDKYGAYNDQYE